MTESSPVIIQPIWDKLTMSRGEARVRRSTPHAGGRSYREHPFSSVFADARTVLPL